MLEKVKSNLDSINSKEYNKNKSTLNKEITAINHSLSKILLLKKSLIENKINKIISDDEYTQLNSSYDNQINELNAKLNNIESEKLVTNEYQAFVNKPILTETNIKFFIKKIIITDLKNIEVIFNHNNIIDENCGGNQL